MRHLTLPQPTGPLLDCNPGFAPVVHFAGRHTMRVEADSVVALARGLQPPV